MQRTITTIIRQKTRQVNDGAVTAVADTGIEHSRATGGEMRNPDGRKKSL